MKLANFNLFPASISAPGAAGTAITVAHGCEIDGKPVTPRGLIIARRYSASQLYYDTATWTDTTVTYKSDVSGSLFNVLFIA